MTKIAKNELGSPPLLTLLEALKPRQWFSAHLHVYFKAKWLAATDNNNKRVPSSPRTDQPTKRLKVVDVADDNDPNEISIEDEDDRPVKQDNNPEEIAIEDEDSDEIVDNVKGEIKATESDDGVTHFTALDKSLPKRRFLEFLDIETEDNDNQSKAELSFAFDPYWLAITRAYHPFMSTQDEQTLPSEEEAKREIEVQLQWAKEYLSNVEIESVQQFVKTAPADGDHGFTYKGQREFHAVSYTLLIVFK